jgi:hypothetical protein
MKKIIAAIAAFILYTSLFAQTKIAVRAGATFSTARVRVNEEAQKTSFKPGASLGVQFKAPFDGILHFSPYIAYNMRSFKTTYKASGAITETTLHYVDLVPNLSLDLPTANGNKFVIGFGPVLGITRFGKQKITLGSTVVNESLRFGYDAYGWFDLGLTGSISYHLKKVFVEVGYYHGLTNINNNEEFDLTNIRNRMLSLNFGYYLK